MTVTRIATEGLKGLEIRCNKCNTYQFFFTLNAAKMREMAEKEGWKFVLKVNHWEHYCGKCVG